jgi:membrane dipeptidase
MEDKSKIVLFDGHNDAVQFIAEYRASGRDFLERGSEAAFDFTMKEPGGKPDSDKPQS